MSFGDHLEELRKAMIRGLAGIIICSTFTFLIGQDILAFLLTPLLTVQIANGLAPQIQSLAPASTFMAYIKISMLSGLILSAPWAFHQVWTFVALGLYERERKFVRSLVWPSMGLFALGVVFLFYIVLPFMLQFFITFNQTFTAPNLVPSAIARLTLPSASEQTTVPSESPTLNVPVVAIDPKEPNAGEVWFNETTGRLNLKTAERVRSIALEPGSNPTVIQSQFALDAYVSFVLTLALAFGVAFETPVVVFFLAWTGIVTANAMRRGRRYVILGTVILAAILTPTSDMVSLALLAVPVYLLFEIGLWATTWKNRTTNDTSN
ncbi:MAG: twin-arginine translocase subunit TatC [Planctomycetota bacterium]